jgi:hypothetical protein
MNAPGGYIGEDCQLSSCCGRTSGGQTPLMHQVPACRPTYLGHGMVGLNVHLGSQEVGGAAVAEGDEPQDDLRQCNRCRWCDMAGSGIVLVKSSYIWSTKPMATLWFLTLT